MLVPARRGLAQTCFHRLIESSCAWRQWQGAGQGQGRTRRLIFLSSSRIWLNTSGARNMMAWTGHADQQPSTPSEPTDRHRNRAPTDASSHGYRPHRRCTILNLEPSQGRYRERVRHPPLSVMNWCSSTPNVRSRARTISSAKGQRRAREDTHTTDPCLDSSRACRCAGRR